MADNEDALAPLGNSEILRVKHAPRGGALWSDADAGRSPALGRDGRLIAGELAEEDGEVRAVVIPGSIVVWVGRLFPRLSRCGGQKTSDVLEQNPSGSEPINDTSELEEEAAPRASQSSTTASHGEVLTGDSSGDHIDTWDGVATGEVSDITPSCDMRPPSFQHAVAEPVGLDTPCARDARALEPERQAADALEEMPGVQTPVP